MEERRDDPLAYDPPLDPQPPEPRNASRAGMVLVAMVVMLFVIGFLAFSGDVPPTN